MFSFTDINAFSHLGLLLLQNTDNLLMFVKKLELTVNFLLDCSLSCYVCGDIIITYAPRSVLVETEWLLSLWTHIPRDNIKNKRLNA